MHASIDHSNAEYEIPSWEECAKMLEELPELQFPDRIKTLEYLMRNPSPWIRQRALRIGAAIIPEKQLLEYLRNGKDDVLRNMGLEILKKRGSNILSFALELLKDKEADVVLQAILLLDHMKDPRALESLRQMLHHSNPNIVQSAIVALGNIGDKRVMQDIIMFLNSDPWLQTAAIQALGNLHSHSSITHLKKFLTDMLLGPLAVESIARIGGMSAFRILVHYLHEYNQQIDTEYILNLIAHVLEGIPKKPQFHAWKHFYKSISVYLNAESESLRNSTARCLLSLGPGPQDKKALHILIEINPTDFPHSCFSNRKDIFPALLQMKGTAQNWGFHLLERYPHSIPTSKLAKILVSLKLADIPDTLIKALLKIKSPQITSALLTFYLNTAQHNRHVLIPVLQIHKASLSKLISRDKKLETSMKIILEAILGKSSESISKQISELTPEKVITVLPQIISYKQVLRKLPWKEWLHQKP
ncbi:MAG: hypothetical protein A2Y62_12690, partial [Candidatus Fischerbacteria bacterium RBG_13_37_8]